MYYIYVSEGETEKKASSGLRRGSSGRFKAAVVSEIAPAMQEEKNKVVYVGEARDMLSAKKRAHLINRYDDKMMLSFLEKENPQLLDIRAKYAIFQNADKAKKEEDAGSELDKII